MSFRESENIQEQDVQPEEENKINFLVNHVVRHKMTSPSGKRDGRANNGDLAKTAYRDMLAKNRSLLDSADRVFADTATSDSSA